MKKFLLVGLLCSVSSWALGQQIIPPPYSGGGSGASLTGNNTFTGTNTFNNAVTANSGLNGWSVNLILQDPQNWTTSIVTGGTGNAAGDVLTLNDGCATHATATVVQATSGAVTQYTITGRGSCVTAPTNPVGVLSTTGSGSGFTVTTAWAPPALYGYVGNYGTNSPGTAGNYYAAYVNPGLYGTENTIFPGAGYAATGSSSFNTFAGDNNFGNGGGSPSVVGNSTGYGNDCARDITSTSGISSIDCFGAGALKKLGSNTSYSSSPISQIAALSQGVFGNLTIPVSPGYLLGAGTNACAGNGAGDVNLYFGVCLSPGGGQNLVNAGAFVILGDQAGNTWTNGTNVILIGHSVDVPTGNTSNYLNIGGVITGTSITSPASGTMTLNEGVVQVAGNLAATAHNPTLSGCGTGATISATASSLHGTVTEGTAATGCTITWVTGYTFASAPDCAVTSPTGNTLTSYTAATGSLTLVNASATGDKFTYICMQ